MKIIIGRVTKDLEPRTSETGVTYVNFDVAENTGLIIFQRGEKGNEQICIRRRWNEVGTQFFETGYGKRFFESQLPELIKSINRLADAIEEQNEIKEEERKNGTEKV